jgi:S-formylglutathione hydrolase FrmB
MVMSAGEAAVATETGDRPASRTIESAPAANAEDQPTTRHGWHYRDDSPRDLRLDLLRGFAVFAMVVDHLGGASWLHAITGGNRFFVSAAELFVFISGLTVGLVYSARARRAGWRDAAKKLLGRSWTLYALAVWLALATAFLAALFDLPRGISLSANPARFVAEVITLQRTFYLVDVMLFYTFAMLVAPAALALLRRGAWWLLALASLGLWGAYQFWPGALQLPWSIIDNPVFHFAPWQLLFFVGMLLGYRRAEAARRPARQLPRAVRELALPALTVLLGGLIYVHLTNGSIFAPLIAESDTGAWLDRWFDKSALPFPRLLACVIVFAFLWTLVSRCWRPLRAALGWLFLPLGQGALYAYAVHLFVIIGVQLTILGVWGRGRESGYSAPNIAYDTLIQVVGVAIVWILTRARFLQAVVAPLGGAPFTAFRLPRLGARVPRPGDALAAIALTLLLCVPFLWPVGIGGGAALRTGDPTGGTGAPTGAASTAPGATGGTTPPRVAPASTVTAPRSVAGSARGSSGLTGRTDQPGASVAPKPTMIVPSARPTAQVAAPGAASGSATSGVATPIVSGGYLKDGAFYSPALGQTMPYGIYLPPSYDSDPTRQYPVAYMLHGAGGHYSEWVAYGLPETAEDLIWDGQIQPMIIVMPQGDHSYFINHVGADEKRWGDYIAFDLVAHIDATYRTIPQPSSRAIGGLSMGGFGALQLAFSHPDIFGAVGAHSPALRTVAQLDDILDPADSPQEFDPVELATVINPLYAPKVWVDTGSEDEWADRVSLLGQHLDARGIAHEIQLLPGQHSGEYWTSRTGDYMRYYARSVVGGTPGVGSRP